MLATDILTLRRSKDLQVAILTLKFIHHPVSFTGLMTLLAMGQGSTGNTSLTVRCAESIVVPWYPQYMGHGNTK